MPRYLSTGSINGQIFDLNINIVGPWLDVLNNIDFSLVFAEIFVLENWLPTIVYYGKSRIFSCKNAPYLLLRGVVTLRIIYYEESQLKGAVNCVVSMLSAMFNTGSGHLHKLYYRKHHCNLKIRGAQVFYLS